MQINWYLLIGACLGMVLLTFAVGGLLLFTRVQEMRSKKINPQTTATSVQLAAHLENVQPADNFRNLFEVPVLFYALVGVALAVDNVPNWLVIGAWLYVILRVAHSFIQCTYNKVYHRLAVFLTSFLLLVGMWVAFFLSLTVRSSV